MRNFAEVFGDEPDRFFCGHPVTIIKSREVHRTRVPPQGALTAQVEVDVEITHRELAQAAVHRFAITAPREIRFRHCTPVPAHFENRNDVISVLFGFQIEDQGWKADYPERSRCENSALEARRDRAGLSSETVRCNSDCTAKRPEISERPPAFSSRAAYAIPKA